MPNETAPTDGSILVIEDDRDIRECVLGLLGSEGFAAVGASGARPAFELLHGGGAMPAVILLDLWMPEMDGFEFRRRQLEDPRLAAIPLVVFSAVTNLQAKAEALGAADCLEKPLSLEELFRVARRFAPPSGRPAAAGLP